MFFNTVHAQKTVIFNLFQPNNLGCYPKKKTILQLKRKHLAIKTALIN